MTIEVVEYDDVAPDPSSLVESWRSAGYTLPTAIADLIDNSIAAGCKSVWLTFKLEDDDCWISITDDGSGMSEDELISAMRFGSRSPLEERGEHDLGRFGLGLKVAALSQGRRLTVTSKRADTQSSTRRWDLDHLSRAEVIGWQLLKSPHARSPERASVPNELASGTTVLLEELDRAFIGESREQAAEHFERQVARVQEHLEMVFHRLLSNKGNRALKIVINGNALSGWDPFCSDMTATTRFPQDSNNSLGPRVEVKGHVLPHRDRFDEEFSPNGNQEHKRAGGPAGWNAQQGFYLYRNNRMIESGGWLGLGTRNGWVQEEHYKLARIQIDIPNSMDKEWCLSIKKDSVEVPPQLKKWLTGIAEKVRRDAKEVYAFRGKPKRRRQTREEPVPAWKRREGSGDTFGYLINRGHPILKALIKSLPESQHKELKTLLRLIEESVPIQRIWIDTAENQEGVGEPFASESDRKLRGHILVCKDALVSRGSSIEVAWNTIAEFPPFAATTSQAIIAQLRESEARQ